MFCRERLTLYDLVPTGPPQTYLTLSLRNLGFDTTESNLLSIPSTIIGLILLIGAAYLSEIWDSRVGATIILQFWGLPLLIALYSFNKSTSQWAYFAVTTLIAGFPYIHPIQVAWASRNSNGVRTRTVSASVYNMFVQAGAIIYVGESNTLGKRFNAEPLSCRLTYTARMINLFINVEIESSLVLHRAISCCTSSRTSFTKRSTSGGIRSGMLGPRRYMKFIMQRSCSPGANHVFVLSVQEQQEYSETTKDTGNQRLDFRFAY